MPLTPDDVYGGITDAAKIIMRNEGLSLTAGGEAVYNGTAWQMRDSLGVFDPRDTLQTAYDNGATVTTSGATDLAITLASGGLVVQGPDAIRFGSITEVSTWTVDASGAVSIGARVSSDLTMQANSAAAELLSLIATNAGIGSAGISLTADDAITLTSALGEASPGFRLEQTGAGGERSDLFIGSTDPDASTSAPASSLFLLDDGTTGAAFVNTSAGGTGTEWSRVVEERSHAALRQLIHFIDDGPADGFASGAVVDTTYSGAFPTSTVWYESAARTQKIVQLDVTYTGALPTTEVWTMYDTDGATVLVTLTDAITYSGALETTRTRTWA